MILAHKKQKQRMDSIEKLNFRNLNLIQITKGLTVYFSHLTKKFLSSNYWFVISPSGKKGSSNSRVFHTMRVKVKLAYKMPFQTHSDGFLLMT